jgi:hypothetical protein
LVWTAIIVAVDVWANARAKRLIVNNAPLRMPSLT